MFLNRLAYLKSKDYYVTFVTVDSMLKNINIRGIPEEIYYKAIEVKGKLKTKSWVDFLTELLKIAEDSIE